MDTVSLRRLIEIITEELAAAVPSGGPRPPCWCHGVLYDCCPDRVRGVLRRRHEAWFHASGSPVGDVASLIDHTLLKADATRAEIETLCREAAEFGFATVCVNPCWVALASRLLKASRSGVCSVVGFPLGATTPDVKHYETRRAIFDGAAEIDTVINIGAEVGRPSSRRARHRGGDGAMPRNRCGEQGHHRGGVLTDEEKVWRRPS